MFTVHSAWLPPESSPEATQNLGYSKHSKQGQFNLIKMGSQPSFNAIYTHNTLLWAVTYFDS